MMIFKPPVPSVTQRILILLCLQLEEAVETNILEISKLYCLSFILFCLVSIFYSASIPLTGRQGYCRLIQSLLVGDRDTVFHNQY